MIIVSVTYVNATTFKQPQDWIRFIRPYLGVFEQLSHQHTVYCFEQINYTGGLDSAGVKYHFLDYRKKINRFPFRLHKAVRQVKPDVVFVRGLHFPLQVILLRRAIGKKVKIIAQHHADTPPGGVRKVLQQLADRCIDHYLFADANQADEWVKKGIIRNSTKIEQQGVISSGFLPSDKTDARKKTGVEGSPVFLWVGNLNENKDPFTVIKSFLSFAKQHSSARLYMIFRNDELLEEVKNLLLQYGDLAGAVLLVGKVEHSQLADWYNSADYFVSGSHQESYGAALSEAMSCGCIPIVTDIPSFRMMTAEGTCGFLFQPGDETALTGIFFQTKNTDISKESSKVLQHFREQLSFEAIAKKINMIISSK